MSSQIKKQRVKFSQFAETINVTTSQLTTLARIEARVHDLPLTSPSDWVLAAGLVTFNTPTEIAEALAVATDASLIDLAAQLNPTISDASPSKDPHFEAFLHDTIRDVAHQATKDGRWDCPKYNQ